MKAQVINNWWTTFLNIVVLSIAVAILSACGGGGGGGATAGSTPGVASGEIEGFGSIIVNGVRIHTNGVELETEHGVTTTITDLNQEDHLHKGMHVEVEVEFNDDGQTGTATFVSANPSLEGTISGLSGAGDVRTFDMMGQTVVAMTGVTQFDDTNPLTSLTGLATAQSSGWVLEVHGLPDGNGNIQATYIEHKADSASAFITAGGHFEVTGEVLTSDASSITLTSGAVILYDSGTAFDPSQAAVQAGRLVEAKWNSAVSPDPSTDPATTVEVKGQFGDLAKTEVEGLIRDHATDGTSGTFKLDGYDVSYDQNTIFYGASDPNDPVADLQDGIKVEAEGPIVGGVLLAVKIKFKDSFRYEGLVTDNITDLTINVPTPAGTLTVILDSAITDEEPGIDYNNAVKIRARIASGTTLVATRVESGGNNDRKIFEAPVSSADIGTDTVELLNGVIAVDTSLMAENLPLNDGSNDSDFEIEDNEVTRQTFYNSLHTGDRVKSRYDVSAGEWDQVEIELDE